MKVIIVIGIFGLGGAERVSLNLANWMSLQSDNKVTIVALSRAKGQSYPINGLDFIELNRKLPILALRKVLKEKKPDVVLTMCTPMCIYTVPALFGLRVKHIVSERNDPAHFAGRISTKIVSKALMRLADGYVFQTSDAQAFYGGSIARRSVVIPNPLFNVEKMSEKAYSGADTKTIISVGRLNKQKNQPMLIDAFAEFHQRHPEYRLMIYGEGPERSKLEEQAKNLGIQDACQLPGATNEILDKIYSASLFVLSSNFEGMPNALMEAMALGLPCISTDCPCGGPRELIKNEENGLLVPVGDKTALVAAMEKMTGNREMMMRIGRNAIKIRNTHSMDAICKQWLDYFREVARK